MALYAERTNTELEDNVATCVIPQAALDIMRARNS